MTAGSVQPKPEHKFTFGLYTATRARATAGVTRIRISVSCSRRSGSIMEIWGRAVASFAEWISKALWFAMSRQSRDWFCFDLNGKL